jgi:hypothetical protein
LRLIILLLYLFKEVLDLLIGFFILFPKSFILLKSLYYDFSPYWAHLLSFRPEIFIKIEILLGCMSAIVVEIFLTFLALFLVLDLVLAVWWSFFALKSSC